MKTYSENFLRQGSPSLVQVPLESRLSGLFFFFVFLFLIFIYLFIYLFVIYGCVGSSLLCEGFL